MVSRISDLEYRIGYSFRDKSLLEEALTHPSSTAYRNAPGADNQRLEFLGDAVLQLVLTEKLYRLFEGQKEGVLTKWRARLVSKPALAGYARQINLGETMVMGKGEAASGGRERDSILSDAMEAVFGALYLDGGYQEASRLILHLASAALDRVIANPDSGNPKGRLQEILQALLPQSPCYEIVTETGPDHQKLFVVTVSWCDRVLGKGEGLSKKVAESAAAADALKRKDWESVAGKQGS